MPARFTLHGIFLSGPVYKVALMLSLAGEPFDYVHVALREGAHKAPAHLAVNRFGQVPALVDNSNGNSLAQSASILEYLADKLGRFGGATLMERIRAREWMFWEFDRLAGPIYRSRAAALGFRQFDPAVLAQYRTEGEAALATLQSMLAGRDWLVGEAVTIADIDLYGVIHYAREGGFDIDALPELAAWEKRFKALPGFAEPEALLPKESRTA